MCIATSGPGATNLVTGLADAMLDSVPLVAITGQVSVSDHWLYRRAKWREGRRGKKAMQGADAGAHCFI